MDLPSNHLKLVSVPLVGFIGDIAGVEGEITLPVTVGTPPH